MRQCLRNVSTDLNSLLDSIKHSKCIFSSSKYAQIWYSLFHNVSCTRSHPPPREFTENETIAMLWKQREQEEANREAAIDLENTAYLHSIGCQVIQMQHDLTDLMMFQQDLEYVLQWNHRNKPLGM